METNIATPSRRLLVRQMDVSTKEGLYTTIPPLFDNCGGNNLIALSLSGVSPFLDWIGWQGTKVYRLVRDFVLYSRAQHHSGEGGDTATPGYICDPCEDPLPVEWAHDQLEIEGFARIGRSSPTRDMGYSGMNYCETSPRYRLDGTMITDDLEWDLIRATEVLTAQDLLDQVLNGDTSDPQGAGCGQMDGLSTIISDAYKNPMLNSIVIDWNGNGMNGGAGASWNGHALPSDANFISLLMAIIRNIRARIGMVPFIRSSNLAYGDLILGMPSSFIPCLLDAFTCWSVCPTVFSEYMTTGSLSMMNTYEARLFRDTLNGGAFGAGQITIEGITIPIIPVDKLITGYNSFNMYLLSRGVGGWRWLYGQYNDMAEVAAKAGPGYSSSDGGRVLTWGKSENMCRELVVEMMPRLVVEAPWAQAVIQDVHCNALGGPLSGDPWSDYFPYSNLPG